MTNDPAGEGQLTLEAERELTMKDIKGEEEERAKAIDENTKDPLAEAEKVIEQIEPKAEPKEWVFSDGDVERVYVQRPLSYFGKMKFFQLVATNLKLAMMGENPLSLSAFMDQRPAGGGFDLSQLGETDSFMNLLATLGIYVPDMLLDSYVIWLDVPQNEVAWFKELASRHEDEGGLSDEEGAEIIEIFIDQNLAAIRSFFEVQIRKLVQKAQATQKDAKPSPPSKPSRHTRRNTPRR